MISSKFKKLLDIASEIIPAIGPLAGDDKSGKLASAVVDVLKTVVKEEDPQKAKALINTDPQMKAKLKTQLAELANKKAEEENRILEEKRRGQLEEASKSLKDQSQRHREELELHQKKLESAKAARAFAHKSALSSDWTSWINPALSILISSAFLFFVFYLATVELKTTIGGNIGNKEIFLVAFGALAAAFVTVISFHFGSSAGSKQKTKLQRLFGTEGAISSGAEKKNAQFSSQVISGNGNVESLFVKGASHTFEAFWNDNLSHIQHFNWEEFLFKGASNKQFHSNTDPDPRLYPNVVPLVGVLDKIRAEIGAPVKLISIYRSPAYNRDIRGAKSSRHMQFDAADFIALGPDAGNSDSWYRIAKNLRDNGKFRGGIGVYKNFVHIDMRGENGMRGENDIDKINPFWDNR